MFATTANLDMISQLRIFSTKYRQKILVTKKSPLLVILCIYVKAATRCIFERSPAPAVVLPCRVRSIIRVRGSSSNCSDKKDLGTNGTRNRTVYQRCRNSITPRDNKINNWTNPHTFSQRLEDVRQPSIYAQNTGPPSC